MKRQRQEEEGRAKVKERRGARCSESRGRRIKASWVSIRRVEASREDSLRLQGGCTSSTVIPASHQPPRNNMSSVQRSLLSSGCRGEPPTPVDCWHSFCVCFGVLSGGHIRVLVAPRLFSVEGLSVPPRLSLSLSFDVLILNICTRWCCFLSVVTSQFHCGGFVLRRCMTCLITPVSLTPFHLHRPFVCRDMFSTSYTIYTVCTIQQEQLYNIDVTRLSVFSSGCLLSPSKLRPVQWANTVYDRSFQPVKQRTFKDWVYQLMLLGTFDWLSGCFYRNRQGLINSSVCLKHSLYMLSHHVQSQKCCCSKQPHSKAGRVSLPSWPPPGCITLPP